MPSISTVRLPGLHHRQGVPNPKLAFEVQGGAHSCQPPLHHDGNPVAQHIGLLHTVGCQHNCPVPPVLLDHIPCKSGHTHTSQGSVLKVQLGARQEVTRQMMFTNSTAV